MIVDALWGFSGPILFAVVGTAIILYITRPSVYPPKPGRAGRDGDRHAPPRDSAGALSKPEAE
jgi:hypothetical protein